jgi:hypothetical protein
MEDCRSNGLFLATHIKRTGMDCAMIMKETVARFFRIHTNRPPEHKKGSVLHGMSKVADNPVPHTPCVKVVR